jgi:hypothetical protein
MKITLTLDFWFDGIDDCDYAEVASTLEEVFDSGCESTLCEISSVRISKMEKEAD